MIRQIFWAAKAFAFSTILSSQLALADNQRYITGFVGVTEAADYDFDFFQTIPELVVGQGVIKTDTGTSFGVAIGTRFSSNWRAEFELSYSSNDTESIGEPNTDLVGSWDATFGMVNLWYDFATNWKIKPYAGGGVGVARVSLSGGNGAGTKLVDDTDTVLAGQIGFGGRISIGERSTIDIGYRYKMTDDVNMSTTQVIIPTDFSNGDYAAHSIVIGYSYSF